MKFDDKTMQLYIALDNLEDPRKEREIRYKAKDLIFGELAQ